MSIMDNDKIQPFTVSQRNVEAAFGLTTRHFLKLVREGAFSFTPLGTLKVVPAEEVRAFLAARAQRITPTGAVPEALLEQVLVSNGYRAGSR